MSSPWLSGPGSAPGDDVDLVALVQPPYQLVVGHADLPQRLGGVLEPAGQHLDDMGQLIGPLRVVVVGDPPPAVVVVEAGPQLAHGLLDQVADGRVDERLGDKVLRRRARPG